MRTIEQTSDDGQYTIVIEQDFEDFDSSGWPSGSQTTSLRDNFTGESVILNNYSGPGYYADIKSFFSPDGAFVVYQVWGGFDYLGFNLEFDYYAANVETGEIYEVIAHHYHQGIRLSKDGSKIFWSFYDERVGPLTEGAFYFPSVPQFALPELSGAKIDASGSGTLVVGDTVSITLGLEGITNAVDPQRITLSLSSGGVATYDAASSRAGEFFVFKYTVQPNDVTDDLSLVRVDLNGASLSGADGEAALVSDDLLSDIGGTLRINGYIGSAAGETFVGTAGAEAFRGMGGDDTYRVDNPGDRVLESLGGGYDGVDTTIDYTLASGQEIEELRAANPAGTTGLVLTGNAFDQTIKGANGNDTLDGKGGADLLIGYGGDDTYVVDQAGDRIVEEAGSGTDLVRAAISYTLGANLENLTLLGSTRLSATGNALNNTLTGNAGDNLLDGRGGADVMAGRAGNDTYLVDNAADRVVEAGNGGTDTVKASVTYALTKGQAVEQLVTADINARTALSLSGNEFANTITGNSGNNLILGGGGKDVLDGWNGIDTVSYADKTAAIAVRLDGGFVSQVLVGAAIEDSIRNFENVVGGSGDDTLRGDTRANTLDGGVGNDVLDGASGADTLIGGAGNDTFVIDNVGDVVVEAIGGGIDTVRSSVSYGLTPYQGVDRLLAADVNGKAAIDLIGNNIANTITGNAGSNFIQGGGSKDVLDGWYGIDTVSYADKTAAVVVTLADTATTTVTVGGVAEDTIRNFENVLGGSGADRLTGDARANILDGGLGADILKGLAGQDTFVFASKLGGGNIDHLADFSAADDTIQLSKGIFTALSAGTLAAAAFKDLSVSGAKVDADDRILYNKTTGALSYDADGSGSKAAVQFATIDTKVSLTHADFLVV